MSAAAGEPHGAPALMEGGISAAFLGVNDVEAHLALYVGELGWQVALRGAIPAEVAGPLWGAEAAVGYVELRAADASHGRVVLLEVPEQQAPPHPQQSDTGFVAINCYTADLAATHRRLAGAGWSFRTPPASWSVPFNGATVDVTQAFLLAPDGVDIVFVQPATARGTAAWEADPGREFTELTSVVCHVEDFEAEVGFWQELGMAQWYDVTFSHPGLDAMASLPAGSRMRLAFLAGDTTSRVEVTRLEDRTLGADHRARQRTARHLGHSGWLVQVRGIDAALERVAALGGRLLAGPMAGGDGLFGGGLVAAVETPNGLPVTFWEVTP